MVNIWLISTFRLVWIMLYWTSVFLLSLLKGLLSLKHAECSGAFLSVEHLMGGKEWGKPDCLTSNRVMSSPLPWFPLLPSTGKGKLKKLSQQPDWMGFRNEGYFLVCGLELCEPAHRGGRWRGHRLCLYPSLRQQACAGFFRVQSPGKLDPELWRECL